MIVYKRQIRKRLLSFRITFLLFATACLLAFKYDYVNLGYLIAVAIATSSIIVIKDVIIYSDSFQISKYYFFGLLKRTWQFNKGENIKVSSFGPQFGENADSPDINETAFELGYIYSIFEIFVPSKIILKEFKIEKLSEANELLNFVNIQLDKTEFNYLKTFRSEQRHSIDKDD